MHAPARGNYSSLVRTNILQARFSAPPFTMPKAKKAMKATAPAPKAMKAMKAMKEAKETLVFVSKTKNPSDLETCFL